MVLNDFDEDIMQKLVGRNNSDNIGIPLDRNSIDIKTNNYGHRLITLCKTINVHIVNDRIGVDRDRGATTRKNASIVDYILVSPQSFHDIMEFEVLEFYELLSAALLKWTLNVPSKPNCSNNKGG